MAAPAPHKDRPVGFLDLPVEIRYMIYELLMGRRVTVKIPDLQFGHRNVISESVFRVSNCFYPAMTRVNKQVYGEYMTFVMPRMMLCVAWIISSFQFFQCELAKLVRPILPKEVISQSKLLDLEIYEFSPNPCSRSPSCF
jgi:hypothetical protein